MRTLLRFELGRTLGTLCFAAVLGLVAGCGQTRNDALQGYVEGEFVHVASPLPGAVVKLSVDRGAQVTAGEPLFALESGAETAARGLAAQRLEEGRARLTDVRKGKRPLELASIEAQLNQGRLALALSEKEFVRQSNLTGSGAASVRELDRARSARDQDQQRVSQLAAELQTAGLGSRDEQITAAEANVGALEAALAKADWDLAQKTQNAPQSGLIFDTFYRVGEWVAGGRPVVALLPPGNIKVRLFVPETQIGSLHTGGRVQVTVDGVVEPYPGKVSFISPKPEYTPPVIYSRESRGKLVFLTEVVFAPEVAIKLHPGQPVDVRFTP